MMKRNGDSVMKMLKLNEVMIRAILENESREEAIKRIAEAMYNRDLKIADLEYALVEARNG